MYSLTTYNTVRFLDQTNNNKNVPLHFVPLLVKAFLDGWFLSLFPCIRQNLFGRQRVRCLGLEVDGVKGIDWGLFQGLFFVLSMFICGQSVRILET